MWGYVGVAWASIAKVKILDWCVVVEAGKVCNV